MTRREITGRSHWQNLDDGIECHCRGCEQERELHGRDDCDTCQHLHNIGAHQVKGGRWQNRHGKFISVSQADEHVVVAGSKDWERLFGVANAREYVFGPTSDELDAKYTASKPAPLMFGECAGCHLDGIYDNRYPGVRLCHYCADLAEITIQLEEAEADA